MLAACLLLDARGQDGPSGQTAVRIQTAAFLQVEQGWTWVDSVWLYHGHKVGFAPVSYTQELEAAVAGALGGQVAPTVTRTKAEGAYSTEEPEWSWSGGQWYYKGKETASFPPVFHRESRAVTTAGAHGQECTVTTIKDGIYVMVGAEDWRWSKREWGWKHRDDLFMVIPVYEATYSFSNVATMPGAL